MLRRVLLAFGLLTGLSAAAWASPMIGLDDPCTASNETAVNTTNPIQLNLTLGGGQFCFFNALTGSDNPIVDLRIDATTTLSAKQIAELSTIVCSSQFFTSAQCAINYTGTDLSIEFKTTDTDHDSGPAFIDAEINEDEGIPQVLSGCSNDPSAIVPNPVAAGTLPCSTKGYFVINLDGGQPIDSSNTGDWDTLGVTSFTVTQVNGVALPEPSGWPLFGASLLLVCGIGRRYTRYLAGVWRR